MNVRGSNIARSSTVMAHNSSNGFLHVSFILGVPITSPVGDVTACELPCGAPPLTAEEPQVLLFLFSPCSVLFCSVPLSGDREGVKAESGITSSLGGYTWPSTRHSVKL
jgi:hypothetical protein